jgi:hypothetical protein
MDESGDDVIRRIVRERLQAAGLGSADQQAKVAREVSGEIRAATPRRVLITQKAVKDMQNRIRELEKRLGDER